MIEKLIVLEDIDPVIFYGVNNANMQYILMILLHF